MKHASLIVSIIACFVVFIGIYTEDDTAVLLGAAITCMSMAMPLRNY